MTAGRAVTALVLLALCGVAPAARDVPQKSAVPRKPPIAGLDHIPVAVRDLDRAARTYRALGFSLKPGRPHANGIRNQHVKFPDGTEIELITAPEARDALTAKYRQHLEGGDGPAFLAFYAPALDPVAARLEAAGVSYRRNPGYIDITDGQALDYIFFGGRNRSPTDRPEHFAHANGAEALVRVWLADDDLSPERSMLEAMGVRFSSAIVHAPDPVKAEVARLDDGAVVLLPGARQFVRGRRIIGATLRVASLAKARKVLGSSGVHSGSSSVVLPPSRTHGLWLELREDR